MSGTSPDPRPRVALVILAWNGRNDTLACLDSLRDVTYPNWEVLVVDNGSEDDTVDAIHQQHSWVTVVETGANLGFAGGNNVGIQEALKREAELILLLNNDTTVAPDLLQAFARAADEHPDAGVFGAKIYYLSDPERLWYAGGRWYADRQLFDHVGKGKVDDGVEFEQVQDTDYACGCAMMVRAETVKTVGLLEERFFLVYEEVDWCFRARRAGFRCMFVPGAKVWHRISAAFGGERSILYEYFDVRNRLLWAERNLTRRERLFILGKTLWLLRPRWPAALAAWELLRGRLSLKQAYWEARPRKHEPLNEYRQPARMVKKAQWRGLGDYLTRRFGDCPTSVRAAATKAKQIVEV